MRIKPGILIEGADHSGKTTLAKHLADVFKIKYFHFSKETGVYRGSFDYFNGYFYDIEQNPYSSFVFDRQFVSEIVYAKVLNRKTFINDTLRDVIVNKFNRYGYIFILVDSDNEWDESREQYIDKDLNDKVKKEFNKQFELLKFNYKLKVNPFKQEKSEIVKLIQNEINERDRPKDDEDIDISIQQ